MPGRVRHPETKMVGVRRSVHHHLIYACCWGGCETAQMDLRQPCDERFNADHGETLPPRMARSNSNRVRGLAGCLDIIRDAFAMLGDMPHHQPVGDLHTDLIGELHSFRRAMQAHPPRADCEWFELYSRWPITMLWPGEAGPNWAATNPAAADTAGMSAMSQRSAPIRCATDDRADSAAASPRGVVEAALRPLIDEVVVGGGQCLARQPNAGCVEVGRVFSRRKHLASAANGNVRMLLRLNGHARWLVTQNQRTRPTFDGRPPFRCRKADWWAVSTPFRGRGARLQRSASAEELFGVGEGDGEFGVEGVGDSVEGGKAGGDAAAFESGDS